LLALSRPCLLAPSDPVSQLSWRLSGLPDNLYFRDSTERELMSVATTTAITPPDAALETVMLIRVCAGANSNKFYELSRMPDGSTFARWGRVGAAKPQSQTYRGYDSFSKKLNEKIAK